MALVRGIHHLATTTVEMERLIGFYERVFEAHVRLDLEEEGLRHVFIEVGPDTFLHPFQLPADEVPQDRIPMFKRGRLDHLALSAASEDAFFELRRRIIAEGAGDGEVTDMGPLLSVNFTDPDGATHEVMWIKPGVPLESGRRRAEWTTVEVD